ncbi:RNA polymerase II elongation factor [Orbilia oligospora]|uniref:Transcription elongation factor n=1 Tax=Orbilia oligospora TaxID=2813651 RepID=A0A6G1MCY3_ORBOL|nr:RNA polymerase II elongation factor [Orbilia oligospora]KAF3217490.1 RNA polymerase II elongation factor [Orbilia oligospora]KAF3253962.1 RNA polymerase II elongation factor [Orbilia oligospora]
MPGMETKDIKIHGASLDKAVREKLPATHITEILGRLKSDVVATEQILRETKIGMIVNKLRGHADKTVSELAKDIVNKWKKDVSMKPKSGSSSDAKGGVAMKKEASTNGGTSGKDTPNKSTPTPSVPRKTGGSSVDPMKRSHKTDGVECNIFGGDEVRTKSLAMIYDGLVIGALATPDDVFKLAKDTEYNLYRNHGSKTDTAYRNKLRSLFFNLKDPKNPNLRNNVISGRIEPMRLASMTSEEMASAERKREDEKIEQENMKEAMVAKAPTSVTDQLRCGKCGKRNVSYSQAQTRSADEPMTTFCECLQCGNRWKFS